MDSDDKSTVWLIGLILGFILLIGVWVDLDEYLEKRNELEQISLELRHRSLEAEQANDLYRLVEVCRELYAESLTKQQRECGNVLSSHELRSQH